jgi:hypothetical protein
VDSGDFVEQMAAQLEESERNNKLLSNRLKRTKPAASNLIQAIHSASREAALIVGTARAIPSPVIDARPDPQVALLHLTDWQLGKESESYSTKVCEARIRHTVQEAIALTELQRHRTAVPTCHVLLGGDLVENLGIFPGQAYEVDSSAFYQVFSAATLVEEAVLTLLSSFEKVEVWEVSGNHGRLGRKGDHPRDDNLDRVVGRIARERLSSQERLSWHVPSGWHSIIEVGNYKALLIHGDQIKSFATPATGLQKKGNQWATGVVEDFQDIYLGHFHQEMTLTLAHGGKAYITPSTESDSEYAREQVGARGMPAQRLHFIDPFGARVMGAHMIHLEDVGAA